MSNADHLASWVELQGCFNFRDLGGYHTTEGRTVRAGRVFRSDGLQHLTPADLTHLREVVQLGKVIDLRSSLEISNDGRGAIAETDVQIHHVPLFENSGGEAEREQVPRDYLKNMGELYFLMITAARDPIARVVQLLAESDTPAVFHCAAGKDRTGVISALILSLLGVPRETIVADYAFSRQNLDQINARLQASDSYQEIMASLPDDAYEAEPHTMEAFLDRVEAEHGSMLDWAAQAGLDEPVVEQLRKRMLD